MYDLHSWSNFVWVSHYTADSQERDTQETRREFYLWGITWPGNTIEQGLVHLLSISWYCVVWQGQRHQQGQLIITHSTKRHQQGQLIITHSTKRHQQGQLIITHSTKTGNHNQQGQLIITHSTKTGNHNQFLAR